MDVVIGLIILSIICFLAKIATGVNGIGMTYKELSGLKFYIVVAAFAASIAIAGCGIRFSVNYLCEELR